MTPSGTIQGEIPQTVIGPNVKILIDTNIYLDFYRSNKESLKLLIELSKHFDKIILTEQIIQEFERNREVVIKSLRKSFVSESKLDNVSSAYLENLPEFTALVGAQKDYQQKRKDVISAIDNILESPDRDPVYSFFTSMVKECGINNNILKTTDDIIKKAQKRKLIGNPPTSSGYSIGDEINWEIVLSNVKENIILVGRDNTYTTNFSFLKRDFHRYTGCFINKLTNSITDSLKEVGVATSEELAAVEKKMIDELKLYNEYWKHIPEVDSSPDDAI